MLSPERLQVGLYPCITFRAYDIETIDYFFIDASEVSCFYGSRVVNLSRGRTMRDRWSYIDIRGVYNQLKNDIRRIVPEA